MKIKPILFEKIETTHTSFDVRLSLQTNITFIKGDSGVGKSVVYSILAEMAVEDKRVRCFNYLDVNNGYKGSIKRFRGKLVVIDNADLLLDDAMRVHISRDVENQYIIIGRNPSGLRLAYDELCELESSTHDGVTTFTLARMGQDE